MIRNIRYTDPLGGALMAEIDGEEVAFVADPNNRHYAEILASGVKIEDYIPPPVDETPSEIESLKRRIEALEKR